MAPTLLWSTLLAISPLAFALPAASSHHNFDWHSIKHLIAFGDSYTYVQGTNGRQNYSFIGDLQNFSFAPETLLSDRIVQNQTSTAEGGPNWVEYLTGCGLTPGLTNPQHCTTQLWDFAFAGSDISSQYTALHHPYTVPFINQTQQFSLYAAPVLTPFVPPSNTLIVSWIGINDISDTASWTNISSFPSFYSTLISAEFAALTSDVLFHGYNKYLFMSLPPLDRTPGNVNRTGGPRPNKTMVDAWDASLSSHAEEFARTTGATVGVFDVNGFLNGVMDDAARYGIRNITSYCQGYDQPYINEDPGRYGCLPLSEYFWFNTGHLTSRVHEILAGEVERFLDGRSRWGCFYGQ
ncbi:carbohydrate esterase family 16 protein [Myriangium duriaei CBS 260.36]|uniref:Carbohydrate esterase family 16 protein n=1 Tax=Myriangium duriaei CBS 260.36 TaxID=1168546 RepID=A0A9P4IT84_9PEZI|nr:carbohydrate esterase family 16 protein [Myriangium duriaei CBS 260.36]